MSVSEENVRENRQFTIVILPAFSSNFTITSPQNFVWEISVLKIACKLGVKNVYRASQNETARESIGYSDIIQWATTSSATYHWRRNMGVASNSWIKWNFYQEQHSSFPLRRSSVKCFRTDKEWTFCLQVLQSTSQHSRLLQTVL